jgi:hypothetical protein
MLTPIAVVVARAANGDDTYVYRAGDGIDTIFDFDPTPNTDTLKLEGIATDQVSLRFNTPVVGEAKDLILDLADGGQVTVKGFFDANGPAVGKIERFVFDDGTVCGSNSRCWRDGEKLRATLHGGSNDKWRMTA